MYKTDDIKKYVNSKKFKEVMDIPSLCQVELSELAKGEYNINYWFIHPVTGRKLVFRINTASQMNLDDQIGYEFNALRLLESSGRTPKALYADGSRQDLEYGVLVMEFLEGRPLCYETDMVIAAAILADVHSVPADETSGLLSPQNPLEAMLEECESMVQTYYNSPLGDDNIKEKIHELLEKGRKLGEKYESCKDDIHRCCVNTELNSHNFLMGIKSGERDYLIDWEKPIYGDPAQDLGHFLAPTTTFWKTDTILGRDDMAAFIKEYERKASGRFEISGLEERVGIFVPINCLRGITWSAMAWVEYQQPGRLIKNEFTFKKMCSYLDMEFLEVIDEEFLD